MVKNLTIKSTHLHVIESFNFSLEHTKDKAVTIKPRVEHERFKEYCMVLFLLGHSMCQNSETTFFLTIDHQLHRQIIPDDKVKHMESTANAEIKKWSTDEKNFISPSAQELIRQSAIALHVSEDNLYTSGELSNILINRLFNTLVSFKNVFKYRKEKRDFQISWKKRCRYRYRRRSNCIILL